MPKTLVIFATRTGQTKNIAQRIVEGMTSGNLETDLVNVTDVENKGIDPGIYDAIVIGSATYHGEMMRSIKTLLFSLEKANLQGKVGGSFGAFGWSGEAPGRIYDTMKNVFKMKMVSGPLRLQSAGTSNRIKTAHDYGVEIAKQITG
jgi:flavorubredoxin